VFEKSDLVLHDWRFFPVALLIFVLPSVAVTVNSGATTVFLLMVIPGLIFGWKGWSNLQSEEKFLLVSFLIFTFFVGLSFINNSDIAGNFSSYEKYLRFAVFVPTYLFVKRYAINLGPWLAWGIIVGCFVIGLVAIYQHHWLDIIRPHGVRNIARFGITSVVFFLILTLILMFGWRRPNILLLGIVAAFFVLYAIVLNHTRSAILSVIPFLIMLAILNRNILGKRHVLMFALAIIFFVLLFFHPSLPVGQHLVSGLDGLKAFMEDPFNDYVSDWGIRPHMYYAGLLVFLDAPVFGTGLNEYSNDVQALMDSGRIYAKHYMLLTSPHNIYINSLAESGIFGFLGLLCAVCLAPIYCYLRLIRLGKGNSKVRFYSLAGLTVSICFLFFGLFHTWTNINNSIAIFLLLHLVFLSSAFNAYEKN